MSQNSLGEVVLDCLEQRRTQVLSSEVSSLLIFTPFGKSSQMTSSLLISLRPACLGHHIRKAQEGRWMRRQVYFVRINKHSFGQHFD